MPTDGSRPAPLAPQEPLRELERTIIQLISKDEVSIPPYPVVAFKVAELVQAGDFGLDQLTELLASDQRLAADILRLAGSAAYGRSARVSSIKNAVTLVGARDVANLALASTIGVQARSPGPLMAAKRRIWQDAVMSALLCQHLGSARGQAGSVAFTAGLLHDFGRLAVASTLEQVLAKHTDLWRQPLGAWLETIDRYHLEVGRVVAGRWGLSRLLGEVITLHHATEPVPCENQVILQTVIAVDEIVEVGRGLSALTAGHLGSLKHLESAAERDLILRVFPQCPELVASFEDSEPRPDPVSAVQMPAVKAGLRPVSFKVYERSQGETEFAAVGIGPDAIVIQGPRTFSPSEIVLLAIAAPGGRFHCWATAVASESAGGRHRIELRPFALSEGAASRWRELLS